MQVSRFDGDHRQRGRLGVGVERHAVGHRADRHAVLAAAAEALAGIHDRQHLGVALAHVARLRLRHRQLVVVLRQLPRGWCGHRASLSNSRESPVYRDRPVRQRRVPDRSWPTRSRTRSRNSRTIATQLARGESPDRVADEGTLRCERGPFVRMGASPLGLVAQLVEQRTENPRVGGSTPSQATKSKRLDLSASTRRDHSSRRNAPT